MNKKPVARLGFSLLEMSIVVLVIAALLVGVANGGKVLEKSRISAAQSLTKSSPIASIPNLLVWYETTMENSFSEADLATGSINTWFSLNPNSTYNTSRNATAPESDRTPTYTKNSPNTINKLPALYFEGPDTLDSGGAIVTKNGDYLIFDGTSLANSDYTIIVVEQRAKTGIDYFIAGSTAATDQSLVLGYKNTTTIHFGQYQNVFTTPIASIVLPNLTPRIHIFRFSSTLTSTTCKNYHCYQTGGCRSNTGALTNPRSLTADETALQCQGLTANVNTRIGFYSAENYYKGSIGEIIVFNRYLNDDERKDIENYLSKKWKIDLN